MPKYAIIDVETTGGSAQYERITEIAIVVHDGERVLETFSTLLNPDRIIPWNIIQLTGITNDMVATAPRFYEVAKRVVELTEGAVFVAHNVSFDYSFIREEFARLGFTFSRPQLCTVRMARKVFPGLPSYSLSNLKKHFGIYAEKSHRALDDTLATVTLFEHILSAQGNSTAEQRQLVRFGIKESKLPAAITLERLQAVPESCGVYYLHDEHGAVIYVGKSINIQKRLFEHFADQTSKGEKMRAGVVEISHEVTGSELSALLLESAEIKRLQPRINRTQRAQNYVGAIFAYTDSNGYRCLAVGKKTQKNLQKYELVADFHKVDQAKMHLESIVRMHELCGKHCNLDHGETACFHYTIKKCKGACVGLEAPESYNERVEQVMLHLNRGLAGNFFVIEKGRHHNERAVVVVIDGQYRGYGLLDASDNGVLAEDILEAIQPPRNHDPEAGRIIRTYLEGKKGAKVVRFGEGVVE